MEVGEALLAELQNYWQASEGCERKGRSAC